MSDKNSASPQLITNRPRLERILAPILVVAATLLTYGSLIPQLGFYRDDWYLIWIAQSRGTEGILSLFKGDRPFNGWLYVFDYWIVGDTPLGWHIYALVIEAISALAFLWLLRSLWSQRKVETAFMTLLFVVYPGFYQQPNALTFNHMIMAYGGALLSLAFTVEALKAQKAANKVILTLLALILAAFYILIFEVLIGLEAVRLLLVWYFFQRELGGWKAGFRKGAMQFLPYMLFAVGFVFWRIFLFQSTRRSTNVDVLMSGYSSFPLHSLARLVIETIKDIFENAVFAWGVPFYQFTARVDYREMVWAAGLGFAVVILTGGYWLISQKQFSTGSEAEPYLQAGRDWLILGALIVVLTTIPVIAAGRDAIFAVQWDRYTYPSVLGVALFFGGLIFYVMKGRTRWLMMAGLLMVGVVTHYFSAAYYRDFWKVEREAWWQLSWRAPQIEDGTTLVVALTPGYRLAEEYEAWGPANLVYHPKEPLKLSGQIMFDQIWVDLERGTQEERVVRGTVPVPRDYGKVIILSQPSPSACLHVLDGKRFDQAVTEPFDVRLIAKYSNLKLINMSGVQAVPSLVIFGAEPPHNWCYYYQKMDLARQMRDWHIVAELADEAISLGLEPADLSEWIHAMEAYVHVNNVRQAKQVARWIRVDKYTYVSLCTQLKALKNQPVDSGYERGPLFDMLCSRD